MRNLHNILRALLISADGKLLNVADFAKAIPEEKAENITAALIALTQVGGDVYDIIAVENHYYARTKQEYVEYIRALKGLKADARPRRALMEVLAAIAMRQPVSRNEIEEIRQVQLNTNILHDLEYYGWIKVVKVTSNDAHLYGTTLKFLRDFGVTSITELEGIFSNA